MRRNIYVGATFLALLIALGVGITVLQKRAAVEAATVQAPMFEVDPLWPKPLPNHWLMGMTIGVSVDAQDNIWIIHRQGSLEAGRTPRHDESADRHVLRCRRRPFWSSIRTATCSATGADRATATIGRTRTTESPIDYKGNVWIGGNGRGQSGRAARPLAASRMNRPRRPPAPTSTIRF